MSAGIVNITVTFSYRNQEMECNSHEFWFINSCEELSKHFPCEQGCAVELGNDVPNYVVDASFLSIRSSQNVKLLIHPHGA